MLILIGEVAMRIWCLYIFRINTSSYATSGTTWLCLATCYIVGKILICRIKVFASIFIIYSMLPSDDICNKYIQHIFLLMCVDQRTHMLYADPSRLTYILVDVCRSTNTHVSACGSTIILFCRNAMVKQDVKIMHSCIIC